MGVLNLQQFNRDLDRAARHLPESQISLMQRKLAMEVLRGVVLGTPIKTGRARGNWQVTVNHTTDAVVDRTDKEGSATITAGLAELTRVPPFSTVYITNNVEYVGYLEQGSSQQAPNGMLAMTLARIGGQT